eukprot:TRINITY_DN24023_c0_g4_i1.p2 TRINITY_DN24023_c0_g4~~TRINITY_DN24023_c0_g4_i1.p2  ORF type:complete len:665 (-),score=105.58 TRINITY_DN24023_c0_g4_i1:1424-3418(-)
MAASSQRPFGFNFVVMFSSAVDLQPYSPQHRAFQTFRPNVCRIARSNIKRDIIRKVSTDGVDVQQLLKELETLRQENADLKQQLGQFVEVTPKDKLLESVKTETLEVPANQEELLEKLKAGIVWPDSSESPPFWERSPRSNLVQLELEGQQNGNGQAAPVKDARQLYVVHLTAEMAPIAKVGGLGDVVTGLARACGERGHNVEVILPYYECLPDDKIEDLRLDATIDCPKGYTWDGSLQYGNLKTNVYYGKIDGISVFLIRPDWDACNIFRGGRIYGGSYNETEAYLYFCRAALQFLLATNRQPQVLHLHEWQTAAAALLYWERLHQDGLQRPRVILTVHNMDNSGECRQEEFSFTGIPGEVFASVDRALDERTIGHNPERLNLLKGGIIYSNFVTTVSPGYADECNKGQAGWLSTTLARPEIRSKFAGILNGIDTQLWNPATDPALPANFNAKYPVGKKLCRQYLQQGLGLEVTEDKPIIACVTRLVPQKGIHLIRHSVWRCKEMGAQFVLLGSGHADGDFRGMSERDFRNDPDVKLLIMYSENLAHLVYAAADIMLVPSMFEPCGLTQMIALRYGALPLVRKTGGLADTVKDIDEDQENGNGFVFEGVDEGSLEHALQRAISTYKTDKNKWSQQVLKNMTIDVSWEKSAAQYVDVYNQIAQY